MPNPDDNVITVASTTDTAEQVKDALAKDNADGGDETNESTDAGSEGEGDGEDAQDGDQDGENDGEDPESGDGEGDDSEDDDSSDGDESGAESDGSTEEPYAGKRRRQSRADRIRELTWEKSERDRRIQVLLDENERLKGTQVKEEPVVPEEAKAKAYDKPKPKIDDFDSIEKWTEALTDWTENKLRHDMAENSRVARFSVENEQRTRNINALLSKHNERLEAFKVVQKDFDAVARKAVADGLPVNPLMEQHFVQSELGPQLMYYLATHPNECKQMAALNAGQTLVALGRLEAKLEGQKKNPQGKVAPVPVKNKQNNQRPTAPAVVRGGNPKTAKRVEDMSQAEYNEMRRKQIRGGSGSRR